MSCITKEEEKKVKPDTTPVRKCLGPFAKYWQDGPNIGWLFKCVSWEHQASSGLTKTIRLRILESSWEKQIISSREYCHYPRVSLASQNTSLSVAGDGGDIFNRKPNCWMRLTRVVWDNMPLHKNVATKGGVE